MSKNSTAQKNEQKNEIPMLTVVTPEKEAVKTEEEKETVNVMEVIQKVNEEYNSGKRILPSERERREAKPKEEVKPQPTLAEIKRKNEVLSRLMERHEILSEKRRRVENFRLSHDRDTATVLVTDANGEEFQSNSPKTIGRLIEFWMNEFNEALSELEKEIRETA